MKKQIRNIVFDMGKVLIQFDPELYMDKAGIQDEDDRKIILKEIYHSPLWTDMDMGILNEDQMCEIVTPVLPEHLRKHVKDLISGWCVPLVSIEGMDELVS